MGDLVTNAVEGNLYYVPQNEFLRLKSLRLSNLEYTKLFASFCRINTLYMIATAGSGHIGSSFSSMDIMSWIYLNELECNEENENIFFSSKGHDAPALYNILIGLNKLNFDLIHTLRRLNGLPGHPDIKTPNIITNTGSLGMGISKAKGIIFANRLLMKKLFVYVLTGDGELQEGQFWESLISAANNSLGELIIIIDHNKLQSDTLLTKVSDLGDLEFKLNSFGFHVSRCDGNNVSEFSNILSKCKLIKNKPKVIIADTIKGKGVSFMEHTSIDSDIENYKFHSGAPTSDLYLLAAQELINKANLKLNTFGFSELLLENVIKPTTSNLSNMQRLIPAYSKVLVEQAARNSKIVALDADLLIDVGLEEFKNKFPERFIECGIAEQDMVSQAGGIALKGFLPIVHSFACFLSARSNEQIYNNSTELTKVIYVGSLAGLLPAGPGHSHQSVRDISALAAIPNLTILEPSCEEEIPLLLEWAININKYSTYIRLVSIPRKIEYELPKNYEVKYGQGVTLMDGTEILIITYGPLMLSQAFEVSKLYNKSENKNLKIVNLPWLNYIDEEWLYEMIEGFRLVVTIDNHFIEGGQGQKISSILTNKNIETMNLGIKEIPVSGTNDEVLHSHNLEPNQILKEIMQSLTN
jgi:transketolase